MNQTTTPHPAGSATGIELAEIEALALSALKAWYGTYQIADGISDDSAVALIEACNPDTVLELIALARATPQHSVTEQDEQAVQFFTCIGKGGKYKMVGTAIGAGTSRGNTAVIYQDTDNVWYFRTEPDFSARMRCVDSRAQPLASTAATQPEQASELPPLPEMESLADIEYAQRTPDDWDADYRATWQKLQVAERNKMQWRTHALQLRAALAIPASTAASEGDCTDGGKCGVGGYCRACPSTAASEQQAGADERALGICCYGGPPKPKSSCASCAAWQPIAGQVALTHRATTAAPDYKLVPIEPTPDMVNAPFDGMIEDQDLSRQSKRREAMAKNYRAMIAAAPAIATTAADQQGDTASADARDAARYRFVKSMSKETLLVWRGMYGCTDEAVDAAMAAPATSGGKA